MEADTIMDIRNSNSRPQRPATQTNAQPIAAKQHSSATPHHTPTVIHAPAHPPRSHNFFKVVASLLLLTIAAGVIGMAAIQYEQFKVQEEAHVENLYATYRSNLSSCTEEAKKAKKDEAFIKENCNKVINDSIIGKWLVERRPDLVEN